MTVDIIIPCYNPAPGWHCKLVDYYNQLNEGSRDLYTFHLIIVNDGSQRNFTGEETTFLEACIPAVTIIQYAVNKGKGFAIREGLGASLSSYCIYTDWDFPFGTRVIFSIVEELQSGADIVIGCRQETGYYSKLPFKRKCLSKALFFFNKYLLRLPIADTQAGIKGFTKVGRKILQETSINRYLFDLEFLICASRIRNLSIRSLNVQIIDGAKFSNFTFKVIIEELYNLFRIIISNKYEGQTKEDLAWN